jgi:hypothetical protein
MSFWNGCRYDIKNYVVEVIFNGMTSLLHFIKYLPVVSKDDSGRERQTDTQKE